MGQEKVENEIFELRQQIQPYHDQVMLRLLPEPSLDAMFLTDHHHRGLHDRPLLRLSQDRTGRRV